MIRPICLLFVIVFCISCKETRKDKMTRLINDWNEKVILIPSSTSFILYRKDTLRKFDIKYEKYAIVTYVDSLGCMSCKLQLPEWKYFMNTLDSISDKSVPCLFFFNPVNDGKKDLIRLLKRPHFNYPVCIDENDSINN